MGTIRNYLNSAKFDWDNGRVLYQRLSEHGDRVRSKYPGWEIFEPPPHGDDVARYIDWDDPILDEEFDGSYGGPECPRFIAEDGERIYYPAQYDGSTWITWVYKDLGVYFKNSTPYPGG